MVFASRIAGLRCPNCDRLQSIFAASLTFKGGIQRFRLQPSLNCGECRSSILCCERQGLGRVLFAQLGLPILLGWILLLAVPVLLRWFGSWGVPVWVFTVLFVVVTSYAISARYAFQMRET